MSELNEMNRTLGKILGQLEALENKVDEVKDDIKDSETVARVNRAAVHNRLNELLERTHDLESDMDQVKKQVKSATDVTDEVKQWKQRGVGALFVTGLASASISGYVVYFFNDLIKYIKGI